MIRRSGPVLTALLLLVAAGTAPAAARTSAAAQAPAAAQEGTEAPPAGAELDDLTARVANQLRCPVCRNQSVLESSSTLAREMQAEIRRRLARGETPEEVKAYFVSRYGEWILLQPPAKGINLLVYVLPVLALLVGGYVVFRLVRSWTGRTPAGEAAGGADAGARSAGPDADELSPEEERRLREAMGRGPGTS